MVKWKSVTQGGREGGGWHQKQVKKERNTHRTAEMEGMAEPEAGESKKKRQKERPGERQRDKINREGEEERDQQTNKQTKKEKGQNG